MKLERILVPTDFSDGARAALNYAAWLAQTVGAAVDVLHVWELPPFVPPEASIALPGQPSQTLEQIAHAHAERAMRVALEDAQRLTSVHLHGRVVSGQPSRVIVDVADEGGYDLIVIGARGRSGPRHLLFGGTAESVTRHARRPVLVVPHGRAA